MQRDGVKMRYLETQNFILPKTRKLHWAFMISITWINTDTFVFDLESREFKDMSKSPDRYNVLEGILPDGKYT